MDDLDRRLIGLLRDNARTPTAGLAKVLRVSRGTVQNRIDRLQSTGTLLGFTIRVDAGDDRRVRAITSIEIEGHRTAAVLTALRRIAAVRAAHSTNGRWDLVAELETPDLAAFSDALDQIRAVEGIVATETSLLLNTTRF